MSSLPTSLRLALRRLLRSPAFAVVSIATLTLAIAANTAIFSLVRGVLWTDLPFQQAEELYLLQIEVPATAEFPPRTRYLEAQQSRAVPAEAPSVKDAAVYQRRRVSLVGEGTPLRLEAVAPGLVEVLRSATSEPATARRGRRLLLIAEVGLAVVVLVGAGLLVRSYAHLAAIDPGLAPGPVLVAGLDLSSTYPRGPQRQAFFDSLLERLGRHPEVEDVGVVRYPPMTSGFSRTGVAVAGATSENSRAIPQQADPGYFDAAGLRLLEGRWIEPADHRSQAPVAVVNGAFVDEYLAAGSAIGREVEMNGRSLLVVGVIDDVRMLGPLFEPSPTVYTSYRLGDTPPSMTLVLRTTGSDPLKLVPFLRSSVAELDPTLPLESVDTLQARLATATAQPRFYAVLLAAFGLLATLLAAAGVYALVAQSVVDQTRSLGIRRALGAQGADVSGWVLRQGLTPVVIGIAFGLAAAGAGARLLSSQLHDISAHDAPTYLAAVTLFLAVGLLAILAPLRRALRIDPLEALREE